MTSHKMVCHVQYIFKIKKASRAYVDYMLFCNVEKYEKHLQHVYSHWLQYHIVVTVKHRLMSTVS